MTSRKHSRKVRVLPSGWEKRIHSSTNTTYYIDHNTQTTHWNPPPPTHALPPPPTTTDNTTISSMQRMSLPKARHHRRSSTLEDIRSLRPHPIALTNSASSRPPPASSRPKLVRKPSKPYSNTTDNIQPRKHTGKPMPPPTHLKSKRRKRSKKHPPTYIAVSSLPPPPPPRQIQDSPNHSAPAKIEYKEITDQIAGRSYPLQRASSLCTGHISSSPPPPPSCPPPEDDDTDEKSEISNAEALSWLQVHAQTEQVLGGFGIRGPVRSIGSTAGTYRRPTHIMTVSVDVDTIKQKRKKRKQKKPQTPDSATFNKTKLVRMTTFSAEAIRYKSPKQNRNNKQTKWSIKKNRLKESIKLMRRRTRGDAMYDSDIDDDTIDNSLEFSKSISLTNPLAPTLPDDIARSIDLKMVNDVSEEKEVDVIEFYSLEQIVERVTSPQLRGTQDQTVLLYTYSLYSTRKELLKTILDRLSLSGDNNQTQIKVLSLLKTWLKTENDFRDCLEQIDVTLFPHLKELSPTPSVTNPSLESVNKACAPQLKRDNLKLSSTHVKSFGEYFKSQLMVHTRDSKLLQKLSAPIVSQLCIDKKDSLSRRDRTLSFADAPPPKMPSSKIKSAVHLDLLMLDPIEVARQICLGEYDVFKRIKFEEFLKQKSTKQKKMERANICSIVSAMNVSLHNLSEAQLQSHVKMKENITQNETESFQPNIDAMTNWFNRLVVWTQIEILYQRDHNKRCKTLACLLKICDALETYNNISSLCAIRAGLCSAPIHRLRKTWHSISKKQKEIKAKIDALFKLGRGQKNLRNRVSIISQPAIPHLGLFLGDIVFIHDGNETFDKSDKKRINWSKMKLLHDRIHWIYMFQQAPFIFISVAIIKQYLQSRMKIVNEDFLYKLSREVEPPEKKK